VDHREIRSNDKSLSGLAIFRLRGILVCGEVTNWSRISTAGGSLRDVQMLAVHSDFRTVQQYIAGAEEDKWRRVGSGQCEKKVLFSRYERKHIHER